MTEKRFTVTQTTFGSGIYDYQSEDTLCESYDEDAYGEVCKKLNELHEENQDFKAFNKELAEELSVCANARISKDNRIKRLEEKIQRERTSFTKTHKRWSKEAENKIKELAEENEQLKQQLDEMITIFENAGLDYHISDELNEILNR